MQSNYEAESTLVTYHSTFAKDLSIKTACGVGLCPIKTATQGPAPKMQGDGDDIIDEALSFFRAQVFFKSFQPQGPADVTLIYLTVFI